MEKEKSEKSIIFISYSHLDFKWLEKFKTAIAALERNMTFSVWDDRRIGIGKLWKEEIDSALSKTKIAIMLVTPNFLQSDFIMKNELPPLLDSAIKKGTTILWIPISHSMYTETRLKDFQAAWEPSKPLDSLSKSQRDKALLNIGNELKKIVESYQENQ